MLSNIETRELALPVKGPFEIRPGFKDVRFVFISNDLVCKVISPRSWMLTNIAEYGSKGVELLFDLPTDFFDAVDFEPVYGYDPYVDDAGTYLDALITRANELNTFFNWFESLEGVKDYLEMPRFIVSQVFRDDPRPSLVAIQKRIKGISYHKLCSSDVNGLYSENREKIDAEYSAFREVFHAYNYVITSGMIVPDAKSQKCLEFLERLDPNPANLIVETDDEGNLLIDAEGNVSIRWIDI